MEEIRLIMHAKSYVDELAKGNDPLTGEPAPENDVIRQDRISRCLSYVSGILQKVIDIGGPDALPEVHPKKVPFFLSARELEAFPYSDVPIHVTEFTKRVNGLVPENMIPLKYRSVTGFLIGKGLLTERTLVMGRKIKTTTPAGESAGIMLEERTGKEGRVFHVVVYDSNAQHMLVRFLPEIAEYQKNAKPESAEKGNAASERLPNQGQAWTEEDDEKLRNAFEAKTSVDEMASAFQRTPGGILARLRKLGLIKPWDVLS